MNHDSTISVTKKTAMDCYELPLSDAERETLYSLGMTYRLTLDRSDYDFYLLTLPLSDVEQQEMHSPGLSHRVHLDYSEDELVLEILSSEGCVYDEGFSCRSFAGWHDTDAWNSAVAKAHQALRDWIAGVFDNQVEMGL